jgi:outer membrane protein
MNKVFLSAIALSVTTTLAAQERVWTLQECIAHALEHNVQLRKSQLQTASTAISVKEAKAGLLPSLNANISQNVQYRPFQESTTSFVNGGIASSASDKATWSGSYGVSASWTIWNGRQNTLNVKTNEKSELVAAQDYEIQANSIQEQIANLYVQILYMKEALKVNRLLLEHDSLVYARGERMLANGQISRSDLAQLKAQVSQGRYDVVNVESQISSAELSLKQLLELEPTESIAIATIIPDDALVTAQLPTAQDVYNAALTQRPEIRRSELNMELADLSLSKAKGAYWPTVSLTGSLGDSHISGSVRTWSQQLKYNFNMSIGLGVQIPIYDNRRMKSNVERAQISKLSAEYDYLDAKKDLYNAVETYWLNATTNQHKFVAAKDNVASLELSYENTQRQFQQGQKDITDLLDSRGRYLQAKQSLLQDKYTALLNQALLRFYMGSKLDI